MHQRLGGDLLALDTDSTCVLHPDYDAVSRDNATRRSIQLAAYLLNNAGARYVGAIDGGIARTPEGDSPYDTHCNGRKNDMGVDEALYSHVQVTSANLWNVLNSLAEVLRPPSGGSGSHGGRGSIDELLNPTLPERVVYTGSPSPFSGNKTISLGNTLVIINTEFNRTPCVLDRDHGRRHALSTHRRG